MKRKALIRRPPVLQPAQPVPFFAGVEGPHFFSGGPAIQTAPDPKPKATEVVLHANDAGILFSDPALDTDHQVGFQSEGKSYIFINARNQMSAYDDATIGTLTLRSKTEDSQQGDIVRLQEITVNDTDPKNPTIRSKGAILGSFVDPVKGAFSGKIMQVAGNTASPLPVGSFPSSLQSRLTEGSFILLNDGHFWTLKSFHYSDEKGDKPQWVPSKFTTAEYQVSQKAIDKQYDKLPKSLKRKVGDDLKIMGTVSTVEGHFESTSGPGDSSASLGIFQWANDKNNPDKGSSLDRFFKGLHRRAADAARARSPSDEQKLYIDAWKACTDQGMNINAAGQITMNGNVATPQQLETAMSHVMGSNSSLRSYQMVAAEDWITEFRKLTVGPSGATIWQPILRHGYKQVSATKISLQADKTHTVIIDMPGETKTVEDYFQSQKAMSMVTTLGVNRPGYITPALWHALNVGIDTNTKINDLLSTIVDKTAGKSPSKVPVTITETDINPVADALAAYQALQRLLWPNTPITDEDALTSEFQKQALLVYPAGDARFHARERRFAAVDMSFQDTDTP